NRSEVAGLPAARVAALPQASRRVVEAMACLGGRAEVNVLRVATGEPAPVVEWQLVPAVDDGLIVLEPGAREGVRFSHDRIREVRRQVAGVLRRAAHQAALIGDYALVNALLAAAVQLIDPEETTALIDVHIARHTALFSMGRLDEADEDYRTIDRLCATTVER